MYTREELSKMIIEKGGTFGFIHWITNDDIPNEERIKLENSMVILNGFPCVSLISLLAK